MCALGAAVPALTFSALNFDQSFCQKSRKKGRTVWKRLFEESLRSDKEAEVFKTKVENIFPIAQ